MCRRCFPMPVRCLTITTVPSICTKWPKHNTATVQALEWVEATLTRLYMGKVGSVLGGLRRMQPTSDEARKAIDNCWVYLNDHRRRTHYRKLRRGGYPLGSGGMESCDKFICHVRLKRSGAWWYACNGNQMLALRCAKYNGTFHQRLILDSRVVIGQFWRNSLFSQAFPKGLDRYGIFGKSHLISSAYVLYRVCKTLESNMSLPRL